MKSDSDHSEWVRIRCTERLAQCERAFCSGVSLAAAEAVEICFVYRQPPPAWLPDAVAATITERMSELEKRRRRADMVHYCRWDAVTELRNRRQELLKHGDDGSATWERTYIAVAEELEGTEAAGSPDTIKASYSRVQSEIKAGHGARFRVLDLPATRWR